MADDKQATPAPSAEKPEVAATPAKPKINKSLIALVVFAGGSFLAMMMSVIFLLKSSPGGSVETSLEIVKVPEVSLDSVAPAEQSAKKPKDEKASESEKSSSHGKNDEKSKPLYYRLKPAIVVNIPGVDKTRYLQIEIELMTYSNAGLEATQDYAPVIRNDLITLFGAQNYEDLITVEGKEILRKKALDIVQRVMRENAGESYVDQVLFSNFVAQ